MVDRLFAILLLFISVPLAAQKVTLDEYNRILETWYDGAITLNDGVRLIGQIQYNHFDATVRYRNRDATRAFNTRTVQEFQFSDTDQGRLRKIMTIPFDASGTGVDELHFFEVLNEFKTFALLARVSGLTAKITSGPSAYQLPFEAEQMEYLYIFDDHGNSKLIMEVKYEENAIIYSKKNQFAATQIKTRIIVSDPLKNYMPMLDYAKLERYARENDLNFEDRNGLIMILDQYQRMLKGKTGRQP